MLRTHSIHRKTAWSFFLAPLVIGMILGAALVWFALTAQAASPEPTITAHLDPASLVELMPEPTPEPSPQLHNPTPLSDELYLVLVEACEDNGVPLALALGVMEQESTFRENVVSSSGCYGLMQLNPEYFPSGLTPAENIRCGVGYLGELIGRYDSLEQAVTGYYYGPSDRGSSWYSDEVLEKTDQWKERLNQ